MRAAGRADDSRTRPPPKSRAASTRVSGRARAWSAALLVLVLAGVAACATCRSAHDGPAVITHPTPASRTALEVAVSRALGGVPVRLADDALTRDDQLIIGRTPARDARGLPLNGREHGRPQHFRLVRRGSRCILLHLESGRSSVLEHTTCRLVAARHGGG